MNKWYGKALALFAVTLIGMFFLFQWFLSEPRDSGVSDSDTQSLSGFGQRGSGQSVAKVRVQVADSLLPLDQEKEEGLLRRRLDEFNRFCYDLITLPRSLAYEPQRSEVSNLLHRQKFPLLEIKRVSITEAGWFRDPKRSTEEIGFYMSTSAVPYEPQLNSEELADFQKWRKSWEASLLVYMSTGVRKDLVAEQIAQIWSEATPGDLSPFDQELGSPHMLGTNYEHSKPIWEYMSKRPW